VKRKDSVIEGGNNYECWFCGKQNGLEVHHCIHGTANRVQADNYGLWVYLCPECHRGTHGVHGKYGHERDLTLKKVAQRAYEKEHSREQFRAVFGRSYLEDED